MEKIAVVTGAAGGIGSAVSDSLAALGFDIAVCYAHNSSAACSLAEMLQKKYGVIAAAVKLDLSDVSSIHSAVDEIHESLGKPSLLVNNGGCESVGLFQDLSDESLVRLMNTDLVGAMLLTKALLGDMIRVHDGCIVNISSVWGEVGASCETAYSAAKAGIIGFTKALAKECAPSGVKVNCVSPGFIDTRMNRHLSETERSDLVDTIPLCRAGTPQDVASAVEFLVSDKSDYVCGQVIRVDGGWI